MRLGKRVKMENKCGVLKKMYTKSWFLYTLLFLFCLFLGCLSRNYDYDLYARLIVGEAFLEKGIIHYNDFLSYTPTHKWYDHEWGSGVVFYWFLKHLGTFGLIFLHSILMFFTAFFVLKTQSLQSKNYPKLLFPIILFLILFSSINGSIVRCQMFSFMFFSIFLYLLEKYRAKNSNCIWLILPLTIIWNNLHGGIVSGLGLIFLYLLNAVITKQRWKKYFIVLLLASILLIINPYGTDYLGFLLSANTMTRTYIVEWWHILVESHSLGFILSYCYALLIFLLSILDSKVNVFNKLLLLVMLVLGAMHVKLVSFSLIIVTALFSKELIKVFDVKFIKFVEKFVAILLFLSMFLVLFLEPFTPRVNDTKFPVKEVEFIATNNLSGNLLTSFGFGSYVTYKLYPQNLIFMDGRYEEVYNDEEFLALKEFAMANENWREVLKKYPTDILLLDKTWKICDVIKNEKDWTLVFEGNVGQVYVKTKKLKPKYKEIEVKRNYYLKNAFKNMGKFGE